MPSPVILPALGESVTEGTVTRWLKQVGDDVAVDEPLLEVSTDKVDTEIPSSVAGKLLEILVHTDETVPVGAELATIGSGDAALSRAGSQAGGLSKMSGQQAGMSATQGEPTSIGAREAACQTKEPIPVAEQQPAKMEAPAERAQASGSAPAHTPVALKQQESTSKPRSDTRTSGPYLTPLVRKMAAEHGIDLSTVEGSGAGGRIRKQDVLDAANALDRALPVPDATQMQANTSGGSARVGTTTNPPRCRTEPLSRLRKVIAQRMVESLQTSAQLTTVVEVDVTRIARLRNSIKADFASREGVKLSFLPFFARAAIDALKQHPSLNAAIDTEKGEVTYFDCENLALAVDTEKGLLAPVIRDAGDLSVAGLARKFADVAARARNNKIGPDELAGGTFTLSNTGSRGALFDTPIINQPQVAILGTGSVVKRLVVVDDPHLGETIAVRQMVYLALTYDHRLVDGSDAARFLADVKQRLEAGRFEL